MVTVADIVALPAFHSVEVLGGAPDGLQRAVRNIGIMDAPPDERAYDDYVAGELIVTNLGFARDDAALAERALRLMLERPLAALAVRNVYGLPLGDAVREASDASGTPLLTYEGEYYEHVIFQALKLIERDRADSDTAQRIDGLLARTAPEDIRAELYDAIGATGSTMQCAVLVPLASDEASLYAQIDELAAVCAAIRRDWERVETASAMRYHGLALLLVTYHRPPETWALEGESDFARLLRPHGRFAAGISEEVPLGQGDLAVREALHALEQGRADGRAITRWAALGVEAFGAAARSDRLLSSTCALYRQMLANHDAAHDGSLLETARALAESCGDVRAAAEALFQHPNTVRYRMRKMREVLDVPDASDRELARLLMLAFLA